MSRRYTLRLESNGAEVWKRWTGDREEALRDLAATIADLDIQEQRALRFAIEAKELIVEPMPEGIRERAVSVMAEDWTSTLSFGVRLTAPQ